MDNISYECIESFAVATDRMGVKVTDYIGKGTIYFIKYFDNDVVVLSDGTRVNYLVFKDYFKKVE